MTDEVNSLLVLVVDTNPAWWGQKLLEGDEQMNLARCLDSLMAFSNAHLMLNHGNRVAIMAAHNNSSHFLYPPHGGLPDPADVQSDPSFAGQKDGKYELFTHINDTIKDELRHLILNVSDGALYSDCLLAGAMCKALCYINGQEKNLTTGEKLSSRILVVKGTDDNPTQYMNFMNVIFTAQKKSIVIDACILDNESGLLQQACDITGGMYLKIPQITGLLQYLLWVFLPDPTVRNKFALPPKAQVDYRAACFCHRNLIDVGYVCSVCLSIFCSFSPICSTCQTTFKFLGPPRGVKKKIKKSSA